MKYTQMLIIVLGLTIVNGCFKSKETRSIDTQRTMLQKKSTNDIRILSIRPRDLTEKDSIVYYKPNRNVKRSTYITWKFASDEFLKKVGDVKKIHRVRIKVQIVKTKKRIYKPDNKNISSPRGGFEFITHECRITGIVK